MVMAAGRAVSDWAPGNAVMTHPVPLRDQGTWAPRLIARQACSPENRRVPAGRPRPPSRCPRSPPSRFSATRSTSTPVNNSWSTGPAGSPAACWSPWPRCAAPRSSRRLARQAAAGNRARSAPRDRLPRPVARQVRAISANRGVDAAANAAPGGAASAIERSPAAGGWRPSPPTRPASNAASRSPASTSAQTETSCASSRRDSQTASWESRSPPATVSPMPPRHSPR